MLSCMEKRDGMSSRESKRSEGGNARRDHDWRQGEEGNAGWRGRCKNRRFDQALIDELAVQLFD